MKFVCIVLLVGTFWFLLTAVDSLVGINSVVSLNAEVFNETIDNIIDGLKSIKL